MAETSLPWTGSVAGDDGPYSDDNWTDMLQMEWNGDEQATRGIAKGFLNELEPTNAGANTIQIDTGGGWVDGSRYRNSTAVNVNIPTPVGDTRVDRIVLRKGWAAQTVRITRIAGVEGAGAPALTQTDGVTWDLPLCQVSITTLAVMTITDQRGWARPPIEIGTANIEDGAVTEAKLADGVFVPVGGIILWSGAVGAIPTNWQLCDGTGGTPDLQDKFVVGAGSGYAVGATGGAVTHTHTVAIPSDLGGVHNHGGQTAYATAPITLYQEGTGALVCTGTNHYHAISNSVSHQHGVNGNTGSSSSLPPYHALCYIMRTA